jgi:hypothetical protein
MPTLARQRGSPRCWHGSLGCLCLALDLTLTLVLSLVIIEAGSAGTAHTAQSAGAAHLLHHLGLGASATTLMTLLKQTAEEGCQGLERTAVE